MRFRLRRLHAAFLLIAVALLYSLATGFEVFYRLTYVLAVIPLIAYGWTRLNLRGLRVEARRPASRAQVGDALHDWIEVTNTSRLAKPFLEIQELTTFPGLNASRIISLEPRTTQGWRSQVVARQRGLFSVGPIEVSTGDPFGLFRRSRVLSDEHEVLVYPATEPLPGFHPIALGVPGEGVRQRTALRLTTNASHIREYFPGDALGRIHWPTTARTGRLMVKQFDQEVGNDLWLLLDLDPRVHVGQGEESTEEYAVRAAASVAQRALGLGVPVGLVASGAEPRFIPPGRGPSQMIRILDALAHVRAGAEPALAATLEEESVQRARGGNLMVITPSTDPAWVNSLTALLHSGAHGMVALLDAASFGGDASSQGMAGLLAERGIPSYVVRRGVSLGEAFMPSMAVSRGGSRSGGGGAG